MRVREDRPKAALVLLTIAVGLVALVAEAAGQGGPRPSTPTGLEQRVNEIEVKMKDFDITQGMLMGRVAREFVALECSSTGFAPVQARSFGLPFIVACEKLEPYLDGHRVVISLMNPYSITFTGVTAKVVYGKETSEAVKGAGVEVSSPQELQPGSWLILNVVLNQTKAEDMRKLFFTSLNFKGVNARRSPLR